MVKDPIVREVREARESYGKRFDYDLAAICRDLRKRQEERGHKVVTLQPKRPAVSDSHA